MEKISFVQIRFRLFSDFKKVSMTNKLKGGGVKILVDGPLKKRIFLRPPYQTYEIKIIETAVLQRGRRKGKQCTYQTYGRLMEIIETVALLRGCLTKDELPGGPPVDPDAE